MANVQVTWWVYVRNIGPGVPIDLMGRFWDKVWPAFTDYVDPLTADRAYLAWVSRTICGNYAPHYDLVDVVMWVNDPQHGWWPMTDCYSFSKDVGCWCHGLEEEIFFAQEPHKEAPPTWPQELPFVPGDPAQGQDPWVTFDKSINRWKVATWLVPIFAVAGACAYDEATGAKYLR